MDRSERAPAAGTSQVSVASDDSQTSNAGVASDAGPAGQGSQAGAGVFEIDPQIERASTPPSWMYRDAAAYAVQRDRIFARSWQVAGEADRVKAPGHVLPFTLLAGCLDEPLLLARDQAGELHCMSNVCTHRGAVVVEGEGHVNSLRCRYHGRRFALDGTFQHMPEFDGVVDFPTTADDLPKLPLHAWGPLLFTGVDPQVPFDEWIEPVRRRTSWLPAEQYRFDAGTSRDYLMDCNWALYTENFLEEFHIPHVHGNSLAASLDYGAYHTETYEWGSLQLGVARAGEPAFVPPAGHPDEGTRVAAWYFWLFPNIMLNFYPWGLSLNVVQPLGVERTRVSFVSYVHDASLRSGGAGADLHRVEMEDEEIVESVQRGVRSRLYDRGRYSPRRETGTHHFHMLLARTMSDRARGPGRQ
ncbi:SRPBCC family protein [soil metagenome]